MAAQAPGNFPLMPLIPPPPGERSTFATNRSSLNEFIATIVVCMSIATILLACRIYTRLFLIKRHGFEDYTAVIGWAFMIVFTICGGETRKHGFGTHGWNVPRREISGFLYWVNVGAIVFDITCLFIKLSIVIQYRNIFKPQSKKSFMWWSTWGMTFVFIGFYGAKVFVNIFKCTPRERIWRPSVPGHCVNLRAFLDIGSFNIITDLILLVMPQYSIWKLQLPIRTRLSLAIVFCIGFLALAASSVRQHYTVLLARSIDQTYLLHKFSMWGLIEMTSGLICSCLVVLPRLFKSWAQGDSIYNKCLSTIRTVFSGKKRHKSGSSLSKIASRSRSGYPASPES